MLMRITEPGTDPGMSSASTGTTTRLSPKPMDPCTIPPSRTMAMAPASSHPLAPSGIGSNPTSPVEWAVVTRRFYVRTFGCQMNEHDSERIAGLLAAEGMEATDDVDAADVVVLNTCCIRENADNKLYGHLGHLKSLKERRPDLQIAVGGCLAQKDRDLIVERAGHVDVVFGTHNLAHAPALLAESARTGEAIVEILEEHEAYPSALPARREVDHSAWVTIQIGCDNSCAFCIVPAVRGAEVSRRMGDIVREVTELAHDGVSEITLLGQNVNSYGRDLGAGQWAPQFADLLRAVDAVEGIDRVRYTSPHPKDLRAETAVAMAECDSVCEHLHLPVQSGSDHVLARMRRGYTATRYLEKLAMARATIDDLAVTTDIIVGFPGETEADFAATLALVDAARVRRRIHVRVLTASRYRRGRDGGRLRPRARGAGADAPPHRSRRAPRARRARGARRPDRDGRGRGALEEGPDRRRGPDAAEQARPFRRGARARDDGARRDHAWRAPLACRHARRGDRRTSRRAHPHPGDGGLSRGHPPRARRPDRRGQVRARVERRRATR